jgi:hypothetical protein
VERTIALELAHWLATIRQGNEESVARNDPAIRRLIGKLALWEAMVRAVATDDAYGEPSPVRRGSPEVPGVTTTHPGHLDSPGAAYCWDTYG